MVVFKRTVMATVILLACAGVYSAVRNMPAITGCNFYAECPENAAANGELVVAAETSSDALNP